MVLRSFFLILATAWFAAGTAVAVDLEKGKEINGTCAACHGDQGAGGKKGEYPRLAGQRAAYLESQLKSFRARTRINIPMFPYTQERELSDDDIKDVSAYLAGIGVGLWSGREEVAAQWRLERRFDPRISDVQRAARLARWHAAIDVARRWQA